MPSSGSECVTVLESALAIAKKTNCFIGLHQLVKSDVVGNGVAGGRTVVTAFT